MLREREQKGGGGGRKGEREGERKRKEGKGDKGSQGKRREGNISLPHSSLRRSMSPNYFVLLERIHGLVRAWGLKLDCLEFMSWLCYLSAMGILVLDRTKTVCMSVSPSQHINNNTTYS